MPPTPGELTRRTLTNRANAARSTGPKTPSGKAKVARNALRHGLAVSVRAEPHAYLRVEALAHEVAGPNASPGRLERARAIAEADVDLQRIRRVRTDLLNNPAARVADLTPLQSKQAQKRLLRQRIDIAQLPANERAELGIVSAGQELSLAEAFPVLVPLLARLDRYERRALSRRNTAIRRYIRTPV